MALDVIDVCKICHETTRAYAETLGDYSQPPYTEAYADRVNVVMNTVIRHLDALADGVALPEAPNTTPEARIRDKLFAAVVKVFYEELSADNTNNTNKGASSNAD